MDGSRPALRSCARPARRSPAWSCHDRSDRGHRAFGERGAQPRGRRPAAPGASRRLHGGEGAAGPRRAAHGGLLACGAGAVISHRTAGDALGLLPSASAAIEVTIPSRSGRSRPGMTIHRSPCLRPDECAESDGIPCTSAARTLLDLADVVSADRLARAIEGANRMRLLDGTAIEAVLTLSAGRSATPRLGAALAAYSGDPPPTRSELERRALELFERSGVPRPAINVLVTTAEGPLSRGRRLRVPRHQGCLRARSPSRPAAESGRLGARPHHLAPGERGPRRRDRSGAGDQWLAGRWENANSNSSNYPGPPIQRACST